IPWPRSQPKVALPASDSSSILFESNVRDNKLREKSTANVKLVASSGSAPAVARVDSGRQPSRPVGNRPAVVPRTDGSFPHLLATVRRYLPEESVDLIRRAHELAGLAHEGQARDSGEPYTNHVVATAQILADFHLDAVPVAAALLHDVLEDTSLTVDDVRSEFGDDVARLVDGVTKLSSFGFADLTALDTADGKRRDRARAQTIQAENLRKLFLAMAHDIRVVLIKLADRLHNMRTLDALAPERRTRIARETMEIYAPLAARLGIWEVKWQLEDLSFRHLDPLAYRKVSRALAGTRAERERYIALAV